MKTLFLIRNRLFQYARKNKGIFILFVFGGILNSIVFTYFYGNLLPAIVNRKSQEIYYRSYSIFFHRDEDTDLSIHAIENLLSSDLIESLLLSSGVDADTTIIAPTAKKIPVILVSGQADTIEPGEVVVPYSQTNLEKDSLELWGKCFSVVGRHTGDEYYISINDYLELGLITEELVVIATDRQTIENDSVMMLLGKIFDGNYIKPPYIYEKSDQVQSSGELFVICSVFAIVVVSYLFLLIYLIDQSVDENITSLIVGAPRSTIVSLIYWEGLLLLSTSYLLGIIFHIVFYDSLFVRLNISDVIEYNVSDYFAAFFFMFVITIIVLIPYLKRYTKMTPIQIKQKYT